MTFDDPALPARFWDKVQPEPNSGCWLWLGGLSGAKARGGKGYGCFLWKTRSVLAHRLAFYAGTYPKWDRCKELDHTCRTPTCVNPGHLELVTHKVNVKRGALSTAPAARKECRRGHAKTPDNMIPSSMGRPGWTCRECSRVRARGVKRHRVRR